MDKILQIFTVYRPSYSSPFQHTKVDEKKKTKQIFQMLKSCSVSCFSPNGKMIFLFDTQGFISDCKCHFNSKRALATTQFFFGWNLLKSLKANCFVRKHLFENRQQQKKWLKQIFRFHTWSLSTASTHCVDPLQPVCGWQKKGLCLLKKIATQKWVEEREREKSSQSGKQLNLF